MRLLRDTRIQSILLVGLAVLLAGAFVYPRQWTRGFLINEEFLFSTLADNVAAGRGYVTDAAPVFVADEVDGLPISEPTRPPGYAVVLAGVHRLGLDDVTGGIMLSVLWLALGVLALHRIALAILGSPTAAAVVCGTYLASYTTLHHGTMTSPEAQFDGVFLLLCWALLRPGIWRTAAAGAALYLTVATKTLALPYLPIVVLFVAWRSGAVDGGDGDGPTARHRLRAAAAPLAALACGLLVSWLVIAAAAALPGDTEAESIDSYSLNLVHETSAFPGVGSPWHYLDPPDAWTYYSRHPFDLVVRTARLVSRTPTVLNEVGALPLRGSLAPLVLIVTVMALALGWPQREPAARHILWLTLVVFWCTLAVLYTYLVRVRYLYQLYPLLLIAVAAQAVRWRDPWRQLPEHGRRIIGWTAVVALILYPMAWTLREAYRDPVAFLGRSLAIRVLDYRTLGADVREAVPSDTIMVSDFAYEIPWLVGNRAFLRPYDADEFRYVIDRFDVRGVALRRPVDPALRARLEDFEQVIERPGYEIFVRDE